MHSTMIIASKNGSAVWYAQI